MATTFNVLVTDGKLLRAGRGPTWSYVKALSGLGDNLCESGYEHRGDEVAAGNFRQLGWRRRERKTALRGYFFWQRIDARSSGVFASRVKFVVP